MTVPTATAMSGSTFTESEQENDCGLTEKSLLFSGSTNAQSHAEFKNDPLLDLGPPEALKIAFELVRFFLWPENFICPNFKCFPQLSEGLNPKSKVIFELSMKFCIGRAEKKLTSQLFEIT